MSADSQPCLGPEVNFACIENHRGGWACTGTCSSECPCHPTPAPAPVSAEFRLSDEQVADLAWLIQYVSVPEHHRLLDAEISLEARQLASRIAGSAILESIVASEREAAAPEALWRRLRQAETDAANLLKDKATLSGVVTEQRLRAERAEATERALVAELLGILDAGTHDTKLVTLDRLRAALTRPDTCDHEFEARSTMGDPYESCDKCGTIRDLPLPGATP